MTLFSLGLWRLSTGIGTISILVVDGDGSRLTHLDFFRGSWKIWADGIGLAILLGALVGCVVDSLTISVASIIFYLD